jgi:hypothetical protein
MKLGAWLGDGIPVSSKRPGIRVSKGLLTSHKTETSCWPEGQLTTSALKFALRFPKLRKPAKIEHQQGSNIRMAHRRLWQPVIIRTVQEWLCGALGVKRKVELYLFDDNMTSRRSADRPEWTVNQLRPAGTFAKTARPRISGWGVV